MVWGQLAMAGASLAGGLLGDDGPTQHWGFTTNKGKARDRTLASIGRHRALIGNYGGLMRQLAQEGGDAAKQGLERARSELEAGKRAATRQVLDRESQVAGEISQNMASRGLGSTTTAGSLRMGLAAQTNRELSDIDQRLSSMYADLEQQKGEVGAQVASRMSDIASWEYGQLFESEQPYRQMFGGMGWGGGGVPHYSPQGGGPGVDLGGLAAGLSGIDWGSLFGGGTENPLMGQLGAETSALHAGQLAMMM